MSTHTLDTIGRKIDGLIDVLLGRPVKLNTPTNEELAEIVKQWENATPGTMVDIPDGMGWPPIYNQRSSKHDGELAAAEAQATLDRLLAGNARVKGADQIDEDKFRASIAEHNRKMEARMDWMLAHAMRKDQPEAITTELECTGIDLYAIEIEHAGRRVRYEAPSVDGVRDLMRMNHEHGSWVEFENARAEFEQAQIDRAVEKFEAEQRDDVAGKQRAA